jgi:Fe2+ or Zn2+ uptake regulation protein
MTGADLGRLDHLHHVLLGLLADHRRSLTTADLRRLAHDAVDGRAVPLVNESVYRALRTLQRLGQVSSARPGGRHTVWTLTPDGAHTARRRDARTSALGAGGLDSAGPRQSP